MKKIRKQVLSAALALSMGFTLIPESFTMTAFAEIESLTNSHKKTYGDYTTCIGTDSDPSFREDILERAASEGYFGTGLSYGSVVKAGGSLLFWHVQSNKGQKTDRLDENYSVFDRRAMYCVDKHTGDPARNVFNNGLTKGLLMMSEDGTLVNTLTGEDASPVHASDQKFTTCFLIACLGYQSDYSKPITDDDGYMDGQQTEAYNTGNFIRDLLWDLATEGTGLSGDWDADWAAYQSAQCSKGRGGVATDPGAIALGCTSEADEIFYKCWKAAEMNSGMRFEGDKDHRTMTKTADSETTNDDGSKTAVYKFSKKLMQAGLKNDLTVTVDGGTYTWDDENGTLTVTCPAGAEISGTVTASGLSWDGQLGASIPNFATAQIGRFYYLSVDPNFVPDEDAYDPDKVGMDFDQSQNYMSVAFQDEYSFKLGQPVKGVNKSVHVDRYIHEEKWEADYNVRLAKFDSETGKPLEGSTFDILEKFDDTQLDNTNLEYSFKDVKGGATSEGSLKHTHWGDDEVSTNWDTENYGVIETDDNYRNWANDKSKDSAEFKTQFEKWTDPDNDPCTKDTEITGDDGFLETNGSGSQERAHNDTREYAYKKGYCGGHPAPEITYLEGDDEDVDEINQKLHDDAWAEWAEQVEVCMELANEGGFFHAIDEGAAQKAMEEDRDQFYKDFTSLTYEYSAKETQARTGYILHDVHTDDIPIEWRTVTSSQYKDWTSRGELLHKGGSGSTSDGSDTDDGDDDDAEDYSLDTANYIVNAVSAYDEEFNVASSSDILPVHEATDEEAAEYEKAIENYLSTANLDEETDNTEISITETKKKEKKASDSDIEENDDEEQRYLDTYVIIILYRFCERRDVNMGSYLNPGSERFRTSLRSQIYVDKSLLIAEINKLVRTEQKYVCVSRPRRFGKSMAADMLLAYYSVGEDTSSLFDGLKISKAASYREHLNQYDVIKINMQTFLSAAASVEAMLERLQKYVTLEIRAKYKDVLYLEADDFTQVMMDVYAQTGHQFVVLIDEWDCLFREYAHDTESQKKYLDFLRAWLKDQSYVALAYMTGILPIKKYGSHSALNMFSEYSMTNPRELAPYFGFTEDEVRTLCVQYDMSFEEAKSWYDGYELVELKMGGHAAFHSMYSPKSVVDAMLSHVYDTYWNQTETYEALKVYIQMNLDGLKDAVIQMLAGESIPVDITGFSNDMTTFHCADDVFALLIHLGYLSYDREQRRVSIPNREVSEVYVTSIKRMDGWGEVMRSLTVSKRFLGVDKSYFIYREIEGKTAE